MDVADPGVMFPLGALQLITGAVATKTAFKRMMHIRGPAAGFLFFLALIGLVIGVGPGLLLLCVMGLMFGAAWGRPLRIRGRLMHPRLRQGTDWSRGSQPDITNLDFATRHALEALWLHDAQKEHASVPAFSRICWMLAAVGAPADLMEWAHRAAIEEIDHARRCFALAAGYGGRSHTVEPMPDLLLAGLEVKGDPFMTLAKESLEDGCLLEDFNADVAEACAQVCQDSATRDVLERIAREERSHADFSWALLKWVLSQQDNRVTTCIEKVLNNLTDIPRPTAFSVDKRALIAQADRQQLQAHGRIADAQWAQLWRRRVALTRERALELVTNAQQRNAMGAAA